MPGKVAGKVLRDLRIHKESETLKSRKSEEQEDRRANETSGRVVSPSGEDVSDRNPKNVKDKGYVQSNHQ